MQASSDSYIYFKHSLCPTAFFNLGEVFISLKNYMSKC